MKKIIFDANNFNSLDLFYDEVHDKICPDFEGFGKNLDAFNDIMSGGFGEIGDREKVKIFWKDSDKSKEELGQEVFNSLVKIILENGQYLELA